MQEELWSNKSKRDARARELTRMGKAVKRSRVINQRLHPMYVEDLADGNTGFGNTDYLTLHHILYKVAWT